MSSDQIFKGVVSTAIALVMVFSVSVGTMQARSDETADLILKNGEIYTVDENNSVVEAVAVNDDTIIETGSYDDVDQFMGQKTEVIDLEGRAVTPGLADGHMHLYSMATIALGVDVYWLEKSELLENVEEEVEQTEPGEWVLGRGYNEALWDDAEPHREVLDEISTEHPIALTRYCGHQLWVNSKALELSGIDAETEVEDGTLIRDDDGEPTGLLLGAAMGEIDRPGYEEEEIMQGIAEVTELAASYGLTYLHDASAHSLDRIDNMKELYENGKIDIRVNDMASYDAAMEMGTPEKGLYNNKYSIQSVKFQIDGSLGARSAAFKEDYSDDPGNDGLTYYEEDELTEKVADLYEIEFQPRTHAIGDYGNHKTLNVYERALEQVNNDFVDDHRSAIEHSQIIDFKDIPRFAKLDIIASWNQIHATEDMLFAEDRVGEERILGAYAWQTMESLGVVGLGGSDAAVSPLNPFYGIHAAVTRQDRDNNPEDGWYGDQALTREQALRQYTYNNAYAAFQEDLLGSIEPGKLADFTVLDQNIMDEEEVPDEKIWKTEPIKTIVGGEIVYEQ
ncbi:amidohydrolase [Natranaerobius thermophilus]|uniref:Amidohydrolase 3 n=1 Tax=Natranaerobius thermophilus (strain ATCC BAA-1301 / DSM 18059 / JW/NM-WN-LF) TaxID=457570 RepID=B2A129_NATTJ|nr:amidohydrolase [Natranaerobius thermophilus]ACB84652.1 Amidohydrolase 3 [Natranaerobius thermophilus JW/NM-WN-LF]